MKLATAGVRLALLYICVASGAWAAGPEKWQGFASDGSGWRMRLEVELTVDAEGKPAAFIDSADMVSGRFPASTTALDGDQLQAVVFPGWISLEGRISADRSELAGTFHNWSEALPFRLIRDNPEFRCFSIPRCDANGAAVTTYKYRRPKQLKDGLRTATLASVGMDRAPLEDLMRKTLAGEYATADAVLVARHGKLVFEEYTYGSSREHLHTLQSATKSVAALLVGTAVDRGEIGNVEQPVHEILGRHTGRAWIERRYPISLRDVLSMSAGLRWNNLSGGITDSDDFKMATSPDIVDYILDRRYDGPANGQFLYNSGLSILLAAIVQESARQDTARVAEQRLFAPLGIERYKWWRHTSGIVHSGGGLFLRARDALKIGQLVLDAGKWHGRQVVSSAWIKDSSAPHAHGGELEQRRKRYAEQYGYPDAEYLYGYQWWLIPVEHQGKVLRTTTAWGNGEQWIVVVPELDLVAVLLSSDAGNNHTRRIDRIVKYILPAVQ